MTKRPETPEELAAWQERYMHLIVERGKLLRQLSPIDDEIRSMDEWHTWIQFGPTIEFHFITPMEHAERYWNSPYAHLLDAV